MINWTNVFIEIEIDSLKEYSKTIEETFDLKLDKFTREYDEAIKGMTPEEVDRYTDWRIDEYSNIQEVFPNVMRRSLFLNIYSFFEHEMNQICKWIERRDSIGISITDKSIKDRGIIRAKNYLKKIAKYPFPDQTGEWEKILKYQTLRNILSHTNGNIRGIEPQKKDVIENIDFVCIINNRLKFEKEFNGELLDIIERFLDMVFSELDK